MKTVTQLQTSTPKRASSAKTEGRLYFLEASGGRIHSANADGAYRKVIVTGCRTPDGIVVDVQAGQYIGPESVHCGIRERDIQRPNWRR